jgi:HEAT repeat protein
MDARSILRWILIVSAATASVTRGLAATDTKCTELLQHAMDAKNPDTRKQAVIALSLASSQGALFDHLEQMLEDKDVEVREAVVASLAEVKSKSATTALHKAMEDEYRKSFAAARLGPGATLQGKLRYWLCSPGRVRLLRVSLPNRNAMHCA